MAENNKRSGFFRNKGEDCFKSSVATRRKTMAIDSLNIEELRFEESQPRVKVKLFYFYQNKSD